MTRDKMLFILERFEKNFEYAKSGMVYPTLHFKDRSLLIEIYNELKGEKVKIPASCPRCILPYIKELGEWYAQETKEPCETAKSITQQIFELKNNLQDNDTDILFTVEENPTTEVVSEATPVVTTPEKPKKPR